MDVGNEHESDNGGDVVSNSEACTEGETLAVETEGAWDFLRCIFKSLTYVCDCADGGDKETTLFIQSEQGLNPKHDDNIELQHVEPVSTVPEASVTSECHDDGDEEPAAHGELGIALQQSGPRYQQPTQVLPKGFMQGADKYVG